MSIAVWDERQALSREMKWAAAVPCVVFAGMVCLRLAIQYATAGALYLEDDAFYYTVIAHHIAQSGVSTFDGQTLTNGYHPLWLALLVLQDVSVGGSIYVTIAIEIALATGGLWFFLMAFRSESLLLRIVFALALAVVTRPMIAKGMEISLLLFALGVFTRIAVAAREGRDNAIALGLAAAFCIGARIDAAVFVLPVVLFASENLRRVAMAFAPVAIGGAFFAAMNLWIFGTPFPISGAIKSLGGLQLNIRMLHQLQLESGNGGLIAEGLAFLTGMYGRCLTLAVLCSVALPIVGREARSWPLLLGYIVGFTVFVVKLVFFSSWNVWPWYAYPAVIGCAALFCALDDVIAAAGLRFNPRLELAFGLLLTAGAGLQVRAGAARVGPNFELVNRDAAATFEPVFNGERVAMGDRAGSFAAFYPGPVTQLEGLVNDREYLRALEAHRDIKPLLCARGVRYILAYQRDLGTYSTIVVPAMRPFLTSFNGPGITVSRSDEVGRVADLAKFDNSGLNDEGDNYLYAWRLTGCPAP